MPNESEARQRLEALRKELHERVSALHRDLRQREEPVAADFAEQVVEQENIDVLYALEDEGKRELALVERALKRLDDDEYGYCDRCGQEISSGRLEAIPYASTCIDCAD